VYLLKEESGELKEKTVCTLQEVIEFLKGTSIANIYLYSNNKEVETGDTSSKFGQYKCKDAGKRLEFWSAVHFVEIAKNSVKEISLVDGNEFTFKLNNGINIYMLAEKRLNK